MKDKLDREDVEKILEDIKYEQDYLLAPKRETTKIVVELDDGDELIIEM